MSALRFSWALIEQRKRNNPLCATGLVRLLHSALSWLAVVGAVQCWALCYAWRYAAAVWRCALYMLGSLAAIGLVLARCARCSVVLGAVQCCALCSAGGRGGLYNAAHFATMRAV